MYRLLNKALGLATVFCGAVLSAQPTNYEFKKLKAIDTISDAEYQRVLGSPDVKSNTFLISKWSVKSRKEQLALFKKVNESWIVFSIYEEQTTENVKLSEDEQYLTYVASSKVENEDSAHAQSYFCIVDLINEMQMPILQQTNHENWQVVNNQKNTEVIETGCRAQIIFLGKGNLSSVYTASKDFRPKNDQDDCLPAGQYTIRENRLIKVK